jgi:hypothetical protein
MEYLDRGIDRPRPICEDAWVGPLTGTTMMENNQVRTHILDRRSIDTGRAFPWGHERIPTARSSDRVWHPVARRHRWATPLLRVDHRPAPSFDGHPDGRHPCSLTADERLCLLLAANGRSHGPEGPEHLIEGCRFDVTHLVAICAEDVDEICLECIRGEYDGRVSSSESVTVRGQPTTDRRSIDIAVCGRADDRIARADGREDGSCTRSE